MAKNWMKKAFSNAHGQFSAKAKAAGKSTAAFAAENAHAPGKIGRQARLALVGMGKSVPGKKAAKSREEKRYGR